MGAKCQKFFYQKPRPLIISRVYIINVYDCTQYLLGLNYDLENNYMPSKVNNSPKASS